MRVGVFIPVQETGDIDSIADLQFFDSFVDIGVRTAQRGVYSERISPAVLGDVKIQVVSLFAGAIPIVEEGDILARIIFGGRGDGQAGKADELVLPADEVVCAEKVCNIFRLGRELAVFQLPGQGSDFDLTVIRGFCTFYLDLMPLFKKLMILRRAGKLVDEVCAAGFILKIKVGVRIRVLSGKVCFALDAASSIFAPAETYSSSVKPDPSPAPCSTSTSCPAAT